MKRWVGLPILLLSIVALTLNCGGGGGDSPSPGQSSQPPTATTDPATNITATTATLNGSANPNGQATVAYFVWGTNDQLVGATRTPDQAIEAGTASVSLTAPLTGTGLTASTTYYFRLVAISSAGSSPLGPIVSFTTLPLPAGGIPPAAQTVTETSLTATSATLQGNVETKGLATTAYFLWGTSSTLVGASRTSDQVIGASTVSMAINAPLSDLIASTTYYFQVVATNSAGTTSGTILPFTTPSGPVNLPLVGSASYLSLTENSVNFICTAGSLYSSAVVYFEYSTDPSFVGSLKTPDQAVVFGTMLYYATATNLSSSTYYYYRAVAKNSAGTSYSPPFQFVEINGVPMLVSFFTTNTAPGHPVANTGAVINKTQSSAEIQSWIQSAGQRATVYFEWDTDYNFSNASQTLPYDIGTTPLSGTGFNYTLTGLTPATTYFYRAVATNPTGKSTGVIYAFRTLP